MLETDEVDEDFFTPVSSTSLASIFKSKEEEHASLKYVAPTHNVSKNVDNKAAECIFACGVTAYKWSNDVYTPQGQLGLAIVRNLKSNVKTMTIYDSNKVTYSTVILNSSLEMTQKLNNYLTFYDHNKRYWCLNSNEDNFKKIIEVLQEAGVKIICLENENKSEQVPVNTQVAANTDEHRSSDTDSSVNKKTKASILSRMANMGQSVLPPKVKKSEQIIDSSDSDSSTNATTTKMTKYKPVKVIAKKMLGKKNCETYKNTVDLDKEQYEKINCAPVTTQQILPLPHTNLLTSLHNSNDINLVMTEQRINNSEIRSNINRLSDKVDLVLDRMNQMKEFNNSSNINNFQTNIYQKLLMEYETKIAKYEEIIKTRNNSVNTNEANQNAEITDGEKEKEELRNVILELENKNKAYEIQLHNLQSEIELLQTNIKHDDIKCDIERNNYIKEIEDLKMQVENKDKELAVAKTNQELELKKEETNKSLQEQIKAIMNDTYHTIVEHFESDETYSGVTIKNTIGTVIKQITLSKLKR